MNNFTKKSNNKFDLILIAAKRARQIQMLEKDIPAQPYYKHKCTIIALQEFEKD